MCRQRHLFIVVMRIHQTNLCTCLNVIHVNQIFSMLKRRRRRRDKASQSINIHKESKLACVLIQKNFMRKTTVCCAQLTLIKSIDWPISACCPSTNIIVVVLCQSAVMQEQFAIIRRSSTHLCLRNKRTCLHHSFLLIHSGEFLIGHYLHLIVKVFPPSSFSSYENNKDKEKKPY